GKLSGCLRRGRGMKSYDQHIDVVSNLLRGRHCMSRGALERTVVVLGEYEDRHQGMTFASLRSFAMSSATSATRPPPLRFGGSTTLSVARCGMTSTPNASGVNISRGFFLAFMMLGNVA